MFPLYLVILCFSKKVCKDNSCVIYFDVTSVVVKEKTMGSVLLRLQRKRRWGRVQFCQILVTNILFVDYCFCYTWVFPTCYKSEVPTHFHNLRVTIENLCNARICCLQSDVGGEYISKHFLNYLISHCISYCVSCPHAPSQNCLAEHKIRHLIETTSTLFINASMPPQFWGTAVLTDTYIANQVPLISVFHVFFSDPLWYHTILYLMQVFRCLCYALLLFYSSHKLAPKFSSCVFLSYAANKKEYQCLDCSNRHVQFDKDAFPLHDLPLEVPSSPSDQSASSFPLLELSTFRPSSPTADTARSVAPPLESQTSAESLVALSQIPRSLYVQPSTLIHSPHAFRRYFVLLWPLHCSVTDHGTSVRVFFVHTRCSYPSYHVLAINVPTWASKAALDPWYKSSMIDEYNALITNRTSNLFLFNSSINLVRCKRVFKVKKNVNGSIVRLKAHLVDQGYKQHFILRQLCSVFATKNVCMLHFILGIESHFHKDLLF